jgi:hypothetical protein
MHADTVVALIASLLAAIIAVIVPWVTFRLALRQDHVRWIRDQRATLYVDMLAEAYADQEWLQLETAAEATQQRARKSFTDKRLPPMERARLGARGTVFGSRTVNQLFNQVSSEGLSLLLASRIDSDPDASQMLVSVRLGGLIDELQQAIRRELGSDRVPLDGPGATVPPGRDSGTRGGDPPPPAFRANANSASVP